MDAKITKKRLARMLSYDWMKIVGVAAAFILVWVLIFTMTATRITPAQQFTVFNYYANAGLTDKFYSLYSNTFSDGTFSYEVIEINQNDLATSGEENAYTLMESRFATDEGDVMFVPHIGDEDYAEKDDVTGETVYEYTYAEVFFNRWYPYVYELYAVDETTGELVGGYFYDMEQFLTEYFGENWETGELDKAKAERDFRARVKENKDKRFKKDAEIAQGVLDEYERLEKYRAALNEFYGYLESGVVEFTSLELYDEDDEVLRSGNYALNICPDEEGSGSTLSDYIYYRTSVEVLDEDGETTTENKNSAQDMQAIFLRMKGVEDSFEYETLLFVNALIAASLPQAD
ncbi:MAG: hypothetical protein IJA89_00440 [Clostridia bacterium]|nr:hypothetical protein [Clostridia bacterium]